MSGSVPEYLKKSALARAREIWPGADFSMDFEAAAERAATDMSAGISKSRAVLRLSGQSGAGKSTQLLPMAEEYFRLAGIKPAHVAVRNFVRYFPGLDELKARIGDEAVREATNAFSLLALLHTIEKLAEGDNALILELAFLEPLFEEFIMRALSDYDVSLHAIACPREISDGFIAKREEKTGRKVKSSSAEYFWREYGNGFEAWAKARPDMPCVLWGVDKAKPAFAGRMAGALEILNGLRAGPCAPIGEAELLAGKIDFVRVRAEV